MRFRSGTTRGSAACSSFETVPLPRLTTERLEVLLPPPAFAARIMDYYRRNEAHLGPWEPQRGPEFLTLNWWRQQLEANVADFEAGRGIRMVLVLRGDPDERVVGVANLSNIVRGAFQAGHLGYRVDVELEGGGYMFEALERLVAFAFEDLGLHRVMANYRPENTRSGRLLARLGFEREGYARRYLHIDGDWRDHVLTARVRP